MINENISFFSVMEMQNNRLNARRNGINPNYSYSDVLIGMIDIANMTQNLKVMENVTNWVPSDGRVVDSNEDLTKASNYAKQCLENMQKENSLSKIR